MAKSKIQYVCNACGSIAPKWSGQCSDCGAWNSFTEEKALANKTTRSGNYAGENKSTITTLADVELTQQIRINTQIQEFDRVLGGGLVAGSVILIGGDPGIGKSTLLLQTSTKIAEKLTTLYVSGEESLQQISERAHRLSLPLENLKLLTETCIERIIDLSKQEKPDVLIIDSIQTIFTDELPAAPGSVSQIRETTAELVRFAKQTNTIIFLVGHVTKEGHLAGPRVLEHMVDTVLYFEGDASQRFRMIRAVKNRFGAVNELGIFAMTDKGLREINNPSAIFLSRYQQDVAGSAVMVTWEGSRPLLIEVQALVDESHLANPRRVTLGLDQNRLSMLLAVLHRHGGVPTFDQDVFVNVVGGVKVMETAIDLALLLAVHSSLSNRALEQGLIIFGEVGLSGEIRPVQNGQERLREAAKHGFRKAIIPFANASKQKIENLEVFAIKHVSEALSLVR